MLSAAARALLERGQEHKSSPGCRPACALGAPEPPARPQAGALGHRPARRLPLLGPVDRPPHHPASPSPPACCTLTVPASLAASGSMSRASSSSEGVHGWPNYGPVPLTRCPDCSRLEPLVRLRTKKNRERKLRSGVREVRKQGTTREGLCSFCRFWFTIHFFLSISCDFSLIDVILLD